MEPKEYPSLWEIEDELGHAFNRSEYRRVIAMGEEYPFSLCTSYSSDDFCYKGENNNNDSTASNNNPMPDNKTFFSDFWPVYHSNYPETIAENASKERFSNSGDQDTQTQYKDILIQCANNAHQNHFVQNSSNQIEVEEKVLVDYKKLISST